MMVLTSSEARLRVRSLGQTLRSIRSIMNPSKEEKELLLIKNKRKVCSVTTMKNGVTWPSIVGLEKIKERRKERTKEKTLHVNFQMNLNIAVYGCSCR